MKKKLHSFTIISLLSILLIFIINKLINLFATMRDLLNISQGNFYEWRFGKVFYTKRGSGLPLLLVHDLNPISASHEWDQVIKKLSESRTVYTIDLLGCGRSDKPNLIYTNYMYVQLISDFIKNIIERKTDVIASGSSSSFIITSCNNDKALFNKIMIINPDNLNKLNKIPNKRRKILKFVIDLPVIGNFIYNTQSGTCKIKSYFYNSAIIRSKTINTFLEAGHLKNCNSKYLFSSIKGHYTNININYALKKINNSIFIVGGCYESDIKKIIDTYLFYNPAIEFGLVENAKHYPHLEKPSLFLEYINIFFTL